MLGFFFSSLCIWAGESGQRQGTVFRIFQKLWAFRVWMGCGRWITEEQQMGWMEFWLWGDTWSHGRGTHDIYGASMGGCIKKDHDI